MHCTRSQCSNEYGDMVTAHHTHAFPFHYTYLHTYAPSSGVKWHTPAHDYFMSHQFFACRCYVLDGGGRVLIGTNFLALTQANSSAASLLEVSLSDVEPDLASALKGDGFLLPRTVFVTMDGVAPATVSRYMPDPTKTTLLSGRHKLLLFWCACTHINHVFFNLSLLLLLLLLSLSSNFWLVGFYI